MRVLITVLGTARAKQLDEVSIELQDSNGVPEVLQLPDRLSMWFLRTLERKYGISVDLFLHPEKCVPGSSTAN